MKEYKVGVHYQEGAVLVVLADSPEQAKKRAEEILDDTKADYPFSVFENKIVHRETMVTNVKESGEQS